MGESALNMAHAASCYDPALMNQFFNPLSHLFQPPQPPQDVAAAPPRAAPAAHPKFDPVDLPPVPDGTNPLLEPDASAHVHLDMVGITATVPFKCQFNIDALRNYADKNDKKFVPSRCCCAPRTATESTQFAATESVECMLHPRGTPHALFCSATRRRA
jgi:hypothetical protein